MSDAHLVIGGSGSFRDDRGHAERRGARRHDDHADGQRRRRQPTTTFTLSVTMGTYYLAEGATGSFFDTSTSCSRIRTRGRRARDDHVPQDGRHVASSRRGRSCRPVADDDSGRRIRRASKTPRSRPPSRSTDASAARRRAHDALGCDAAMARTPRRRRPARRRTWYFAEGSQGFFSTYLLLANPQTDGEHRARDVLPRKRAARSCATYPLEPDSRMTIDAGADAELRDHSFGVACHVRSAGRGRARDVLRHGSALEGGHESAGVDRAVHEWFLAEGATGRVLRHVRAARESRTTTPAESRSRILPDRGVPVTRTVIGPGAGSG